MHLAPWECLGIHEYNPKRPSEHEKTHRPGAFAKVSLRARQTVADGFPKTKKCFEGPH